VLAEDRKERTTQHKSFIVRNVPLFTAEAGQRCHELDNLCHHQQSKNAVEVAGNFFRSPHARRWDFRDPRSRGRASAGELIRVIVVNLSGDVGRRV